MRTLVRAALIACLFAPFLLISSISAEAEIRTLKLYYVHTKERAEITFKRNGRYDQAGLKKLNRFLRDWRRNEPTKMDPKLFDVLWEAYQMVGARDYIHVVSAYRSPATNEMLRRKRGGQARKSQHMYGKAVDFYIPGVKLAKLREAGFKLQGGGVGYYPKSGSPFVHFDTGNVRAWPRMSRGELSRVFPDGKTLHLPPDGKPLPGYNQALAEYKARQSRGIATANVRGRRGRINQPTTVQVASRSDGAADDNSGGRSLISALFGGADRAGSTAEAAAPARRRPAPSQAVRTPEPPSPATVIAALSADELPLPVSAPRARPLIPDRPVAVASASTNVPRPLALVPGADAEVRPLIPGLEKQQRPGRISIAENESRRSGAEIEAALNGVPSQNALERSTVSTVLPAANPVVLPRNAKAAVPVPVPAPRRPAAAQPAVEVAALPVPAPRQRLSDATPLAVEAGVPAGRPETDGPVIAALAPNADARVRAAYDTGVVTTTKTTRPPVRQQRGDRSLVLVSADAIDPARFASRTTASVGAAGDRGAQQPTFTQNALREAMERAYPTGFRHLPPPDPRRFSGKPSNSLAAARFRNTGNGDGEPLTLRIPATN